MKNLKSVIEELLKSNEMNNGYCSTAYTEGYYHGIHDALVDVMNAMEIEHNEEYYNE